jgi:uncharacterized repeat protein (TIGR04052 family)
MLRNHHSASRSHALAYAPLVGALTLAAGCGGPEPVALRFEGLVGGEPAACGQTYEGVGASGSALTLLDFRLFVHDVRLVTTDGREVPVTLDDDGTYQADGVALLDFEDGTNGCESGTAARHDVLRGTVDAAGPFSGLRFRLGVPADLNHGDASTARPPLSTTSMFWGWNGGYKFLRVDARTSGMAGGWLLHVGSTGCTGDGRGEATCAQENRAEIELTGFDPSTDTIAVDLGALLAESDVDADLGGAPGCMSGFDDPDCEPIFHGLGLPFAGNPPTSPQRLFEVR